MKGVKTHIVLPVSTVKTDEVAPELRPVRGYRWLCRITQVDIGGPRQAGVGNCPARGYTGAGGNWRLPFRRAGGRDLGAVIKAAALALLVLALALLILQQPSLGDQDLLVYWSASRLLAVGSNPYDLAALGALQGQVRPAQGPTLAAWNPPWLLVALLPLAILPFELARTVWVLANLGCFLLSASPCHRLFGEGDDRLSVLVASVAFLWFGESPATVDLGQVSTLLLLGLVLGSWWLKRNRDGLAGAAFFLLTVKRHISYLVLALLALWAVRTRRWGVFAGGVAAALVSVVLLTRLRPDWLVSWLTLVGARSFGQYVTSTLGGLAYALWGRELPRFAGLLTVLALPWLVKLACREGWFTAMNVALLLSVPLAPYGFGFDHVVLLPAVAQVLCWLREGRLPRHFSRAVAAGLTATYLALFVVLTRPVLYYHWRAWTPLALGALYALAYCARSARGPTRSQQDREFLAAGEKP